ncbi:hypothetical protein [Cytobacillus firmus]|uniref:hypothetical protein n=1 Tax=Cytobacillus firmus TaxID=1399 RepID=UPI002494531A|nr:hypothetical protein [Cytobacillus firmus]
MMKKFRIVGLAFILLLGIFLFGVSIPVTSELVMEKVYDFEMKNKYRITELNEMYKGVPTEYEFGGSKIDIYRILKENESYKDPWDRLVVPAAIYITVDSLTQEVLKDYPVEIGQEGLNQYTHYISYWRVLDKKTDQESFVIVLQMNGAKDGMIGNRMEDFVPIEELKYMAITIEEDGTLTKEPFTYKNKDKLQTKLIPPMYFGGAGYYTDDWNGYPVFYFPYLYPFLTTILGILFIYTAVKKLRKPV